MDWSNVYAFAVALKDSGKVVRVRRAFDLVEEGDDLPMRLSAVTAMYSPLRQHPLLMPLQLGQAGLAASLVVSSEDEKWLKDGAEVAALFSTAIEFFRSRIAGYPSIRVPHLRPGSPHEYRDPFVVSGFPWERGMRQMRLQLQSAPEFAGALESGQPIANLLQAALVDLEASPTWERFVAARAALQPHDVERLSEIGREFSARMQPALVQAATGGFLMGDMEYRVAMIADLVENSEGYVRDYLLAFEGLNELLNVTAALIETVVVNDGIPNLIPDQLMVGEGDDLRPVHLIARGGVMMSHAGTILHVTGPRVPLTGFVYPKTLRHDLKGLLDNPVETVVADGSFSAD